LSVHPRYSAIMKQTNKCEMKKLPFMQKTTLLILPCTAKDIPAILRVALQSYREHYPYLWTDRGENYIRNNFTAEILAREIETDKSYFYLLQVGDEPVGFLKINDEKPLAPYPAGECLELERIYLLQKVSGKGIGKQVVEFVLRLAAERSRSIVWLKAMDSSPARKFYEKMGFTSKEAYQLDFPYMKDEFRTILVMERSI
jgi:diamine N-acetyltransferase